MNRNDGSPDDRVNRLLTAICIFALKIGTSRRSVSSRRISFVFVYLVNQKLATDRPQAIYLHVKQPVFVRNFFREVLILSVIVASLGLDTNKKSRAGAFMKVFVYWRRQWAREELQALFESNVGV